MVRKTSSIRGTTPEIEAAARRFRKNLTLAEARLWDVLSNRKLSGLKFRCQHPIGRFILDFYCPALKLAIEVDGEVHETQSEYDQARTDQLEAHGYRVLRFSNEDVLQNLPMVVASIKSFVEGQGI